MNLNISIPIRNGARFSGICLELKSLSTRNQYHQETQSLKTRNSAHSLTSASFECACIMIIPGGETQRAAHRHDTGCMRRRAAGAVSLSALNYDPTCFLVLTSFLSLSTPSLISSGVRERERKREKEREGNNIQGISPFEWLRMRFILLSFFTGALVTLMELKSTARAFKRGNRKEDKWSPLLLLLPCFRFYLAVC